MNRAGFGILAAVMTLSLAMPPGEIAAGRPAKFDADKALAQARDLARSGNPSGSEALVDQVLARDRRNVDAHLQKGTLQARRGDLDGAEASYRQVLGRAPKYTDAYVGLSQVYLNRREPENAQIVLDWIPADATRGPDVTAQQGRIDRAQGRFWRARKKFQEAQTAQPDNTDYSDESRDTPIFTNTTVVESEHFERSGATTVFTNILTLRPDRRFTADVVAEHRIRNQKGPDATRGGLGLTVAPVEWFSVRGQFLESSDRAAVPSRYDLETDIRVLPSPGTHLLGGLTYYAGEPVDTVGQNLGVKQYLTDKLAVQAQRFWAKDDGPGAEGAKTDVFRVLWEDPRVRNLSVGYATGNEAFRVDEVAILPGRSYDLESVFVAGKEWIGRNWGVLGGAAYNNRSNGNDSTSFSAGVFVEF